MVLQDWFTRRRQDHPFSEWPQDVLSVPALEAGKFLRYRSLAGNQIRREPEPFSTLQTLILALGETGENVLFRLAEKMPAGRWPPSLRALLISTGERSRLPPLPYVRVHFIASVETPSTAMSSRRTHVSRCFRQVTHYRRFQGWLHENLLDLEGQIQCLLVGSLVDEEIAIGEDVLFLLRTLPTASGRPNMISRVAWLLTVSSTSREGRLLREEERFAALREIGRLTFAGPHEASGLGEIPFLEQPLLDHVFLVDPRPFVKSFDSQAADSLAEALFVLCHPASTRIWEDLSNELRNGSELRARIHQVFFHSFGIASVYMPVEAIRQYVASRLAYALMFGEHPEHPEGLIQRSLRGVEPDRWGRHLLLGGPVRHPFFDWFLTLDETSIQRSLPPLPENMLYALQMQISQVLVRLLNQEGMSLSQLRSVLQWLATQFQERLQWLERVGSRQADSPERQNFHQLLKRGHEFLRALVEETQQWERVLSLQTGLPSTTGWHKVSLSTWRIAETSQETSQLEPVLSAGFHWWRIAETSQETSQPLPSVHAWLQEQRNRAERRIVEASQGEICRSALSEPGDPLSPVREYYERVVRPELSYHDRQETLFPQLRERLEWWIDWTPGQAPQLYLIVWPLDSPPLSAPPANIRFRSNQASELARAVYDLCMAHTISLEGDLHGNWFAQTFEKSTSFLQRASEVYLEYDPDQAARFANAALRRSYLISPMPLPSNGALLREIFPDTARIQIGEIAAGPVDELIACTLRFNIPQESIRSITGLQREYVNHLADHLHIYPPEAIAAQYEKKAWRNQRHRTFLVPDLVIFLTDQRLLTLFFQALFCGWIEREKTTGQEFWTLRAIEGFPSQRLAPGDDQGLIRALRRFVFELPRDPDRNTLPYHPFHPYRREHFLATLQQMIRETSLSAEGRAVRERFRKEELPRWERMSRQDKFLESFYTLLRGEIDEPVYPLW